MQCILTKVCLSLEETKLPLCTLLHLADHACEIVYLHVAGPDLLAEVGVLPPQLRHFLPEMHNLHTIRAITAAQLSGLCLLWRSKWLGRCSPQA